MSHFRVNRKSLSGAFVHTGIILNSGFEIAGTDPDLDAFADWEETLISPSVVARDVADKKSGLASCRLDVGSGAQNANISQVIQLVEGVRYRLSFWYKHSVAGKTSKLLFVDNDTTTWYLQADGSWGDSGVTIPNVLDWTYYSIDFYPKEGITDYEINLARNSASASFWFDDVRIEQYAS